LKTRKILIVDDNKHIVTLLKLRLDSHGHQTIVACDGHQALAMARAELPDLIILDCMLPKMDGFHVCRLLKFDEKHRHIPIILCSSRAHKDDIKMGEEVGADAYVTKPFKGEELMGKVKELLK